MTERKKFEFSMDDIQKLILQKINSENGLELTEDDVEIVVDENGKTVVFQKEHYENLPPHVEANNYHEIHELLQWALDNNELLEIVYCKRRRGQEDEVTARIITVTSIDDEYLRTKCHLTLRGEGQPLEHLPEGSNHRTFVIPNIQSVRLSNLE